MAFIPAASGVVDDDESEVEKLQKRIRFYETEIDALGTEKGALRKDVERLKKIMSHVPGRIALEATEKAGFGSAVHVMARPSTGHPAAEYRCNICGGVVHFDGTPPVAGNWGGRT